MARVRTKEQKERLVKAWLLNGISDIETSILFLEGTELELIGPRLSDILLELEQVKTLMYVLQPSLDDERQIEEKTE